MYLLSQKNIDANTKGYNGYTLLHYACQRINRFPLDLFKLLIETHGCDINVWDDDLDNIPLYSAFEGFNPDNDDVLAHGITVLRYLLSQCNVEAGLVNKNDSNLLHRACQMINKLPLDIFKALIETLGCDISAIEYHTSYTPLYYAFEHLNPDNGDSITVIKYLLSQWDFESNHGRGDTLLHLACQFINDLPLDIFKVLIETHGCDINANDDCDGTPLCCAFEDFNPNDGGDINVLLYLLNQKNIKDKNGYTLLHDACVINLPSTTEEPDTFLCQIVEVIVERCVQEVLDETTP
jgi:ankyrin repeat protein